MPRAIWTGVVQFVLISFPVKLYKATDDKGVNFKTFHQCGNSIHLKKWCEVCGREALPNELEKGYEIAKGRFVMFNEEEIDANLPESSKIIKIEKAVPADEIPLITYEGNYFLVPDKGGEHVYNLLFNALSLRPKVLIGKIVQRNKEHIVAIRPYNGGLLLSMVHFEGEVRDINEVMSIKDKKVDQKELDLTVGLLDYLTGSFRDINQKNTFKETIDMIADMKSQGKIITITEKKPSVTTGSLIDALQKSLDLSKAGGITVLGDKDEKIIKIEESVIKAEVPIKKELDSLYGITEAEINKIILEQTIEEKENRIKILKELEIYKSFADYVKDHMQEFEAIEISPDFRSITIEDEKYPRINIPILKRVGVVADHFGIIIYIKSKKQHVSKRKEDETLKLA